MGLFKFSGRASHHSGSLQAVHVTHTGMGGLAQARETRNQQEMNKRGGSGNGVL